jgi:hypothetical protein
MKNIVIEKTEQNLTIKNPVKLFINHDATSIIGTAEVRYKGNEMRADLSLMDSFKEKGKFYPSIKFMRDNGSGECKLLELSLCTNPNVDESIPPVIFE